MTGSNTFINSTSLGDVDDGTRLVIRKHVMRGKNRRKHVAKLRAGSWMNRGGTREIRDSVEARPPSLDLARPACLLSDSSTLQSAQPLPPYMLRLILNYFTVLINSFYPIEMCLAFDSRNSFWFEYISIDAAYLHSLLWAAQTYFGALQGCPNVGSTALFHEQQTLALLRRRLDDVRLATSDSTISVVAIMVMLCVVSGKDTAARKHMAGLHQIVMLRGGIRELKSNTQLQIKVCRADLSIALTNGCRPFFFSGGSISWEPYLATRTDVKHASSSPLVNFDVDPRLISIFADLRKFSVSANLASQSREKIQPELFQETLISIQYRLVLLDLEEEDRYPLNEALRIGLLAFSATVFLQIRSVKVRFTHLSKQLNSVLHMVCQAGEYSGTTKIWYLFIAAIIAVATGTGNAARLLLTKTLESAGLESWNEVRAVLKELLWIDMIHDVPGKSIFEQAIEQEHV